MPRVHFYKKRYGHPRHKHANQASEQVHEDQASERVRILLHQIVTQSYQG